MLLYIIVSEIILSILSVSVFYKSSVHYDGDLTLLASGQALAASIKGVWTRVKVLDSDVEQGLVKVLK